MTCDDPTTYPSLDLQEYLEERERERETEEEDKKARLVESVKKAKSKYYQKNKNNPDFQENIKKNSKIYYERHKDEPEFREAQRLRVNLYSALSSKNLLLA